MPAYNFKCPVEGSPHTFEVIQKMSEYTGEVECPLHLLYAKRTYEGQTAPAAINTSSGYETTYSDYIQLGKKFSSAKEQDAYAKSLGLEAISKSEHERGSYVAKGDDRIAEWETAADVRQRREDAELIKQETYSLIRQNGGVHTRDGTVYELNEKNQLARKDDPTKILSITPAKEEK